MRRLIPFFVLFFVLPVTGRAIGYFEVKLKDAVIFNSGTSTEKLIRLERVALSELDLMAVAYYENNASPEGDYELRLQSPNKENEVIFANDQSSFVFHMSWVLQRQFIGKLISISLIYKNNGKELKAHIFDLELY